MTPVPVAVDRSLAIRQHRYQGSPLGGRRGARVRGRGSREGRVQSHPRGVAPAKLGSLRRAGGTPSEGSITHGWEPLWSAERLGRWSHTVRGSSPDSRNRGQRYPRRCARMAGKCRPAKPLLLIIDMDPPCDQRHRHRGHMRSGVGVIGRSTAPARGSPDVFGPQPAGHQHGSDDRQRGTAALGRGSQRAGPPGDRRKGAEDAAGDGDGEAAAFNRAPGRARAEPRARPTTPTVSIRHPPNSANHSDTSCSSSPRHCIER